MKKEKGWKYIDEYRRYQGNIHQLYFEGKWVNINLKSDTNE